MAYITALEVKKGLDCLGIEALIATCEPSQRATLVHSDRLRVAVRGNNGVIISYHLADPNPDDPMTFLIAFAFPELHHQAPPDVQELVNHLVP